MHHVLDEGACVPAAGIVDALEPGRQSILAFGDGNFDRESAAICLMVDVGAVGEAQLRGVGVVP